MSRLQRHSLRQLTFHLAVLASLIMLYNLLWVHSRLPSSTSSMPEMSSAAHTLFLNGRRKRLGKRHHSGAFTSGFSPTVESASHTSHANTEQDEMNDEDCSPPLQGLSHVRKCVTKAAPSMSGNHTTFGHGLLHTMSARCRESIATWEDAQECLIYSKAKSNSIKHVHIIGERNSGTKFVTREIQQCFSARASTNTTTNFRIHRDFIRSKHFFQPILWQEDYSESFVIVVVRNPVDWIAAMRQQPYHSPCHLRGFNSTGGDASKTASSLKPIPLSWDEFVRKPWTMPRQGEPFDLYRRLDSPLSKALQAAITKARQSQKAPITTWKDFASTASFFDYSSNNSSASSAVVGVGGGCTERFQPDEVVPCIYDKSATHFVPAERLRGYEPLYEMKRRGWKQDDGDTAKNGNAYASLLDLRADKFLNFVLELPLYMTMGGFLIVRYEDLLKQGTLPMLQNVASMVQSKKGSSEQPLPAQCRPTEPQPDRLAQRRPVPVDVRNWIERNSNVGMERLLGYYSDITQALE